MNRILSLLLCTALVLGGSTALADNTEKNIDVHTNYVNIEIDGETKNVRNFLSDGTTYVALRDVSELLSCTVAWDDSTKTAVITTNDTTDATTTEPASQTDSAQETIAVLEDYANITIDGEAKDVRNFLSAGTIYIALRDVSEVLNCGRGWDGTTNTAIVVSDKMTLSGKTVMTVNGQAVTDTEYSAMYLTYMNEGDLNTIMSDIAAMEILDQKVTEFNFCDRSDAEKEAAQMLEGAEALFGESIYESCPKEQLMFAYTRAILFEKLSEYMHSTLPEYKDLEAEAKQYYDANKPDFEGKFVRVKHILIPTSDSAEKTANAIYKKATVKNFDKLIAENNNDPAQPEDGYLVYEGSDYVPEFEAAALELKKNQISKPVKTDYGYHIIMATDVYDHYPFDAFYSDYTTNAYIELDNMYIEKWVNEAEIEYNEKLIRAVSVLTENNID